MSSPWYDVLYKLVTGEIEPIKALNHARSLSRLNSTFAEDTATSSKLNQISTNVPCPENIVTSMNIKSNIESQRNVDKWNLGRENVRLDPTSNVIAGGFGGMASLVVGYPLDTVKVRLQTDDKRAYKGGFDCFKHIIKKEGPLSLFRGMSGLFVFATPRLALIFHGNSMGLRFIRGAFDEDPTFGQEPCVGAHCIGSLPVSHQPTMGEVLVAGMISQLAVVPLVTQPCERIKVLLQTQDPGASPSQLDCLKEVIKRDGIIKGLYRGTMLTYARDIPSFATYFWTYEMVKSFLSKQNDALNTSKRNSYSYIGSHDILDIVIAGACAGVAGWAIAIPFDVIKNRHQAVNSGSIYSTIDTLWRNAGINGFYRGAIPILVRAIPANAAAFLGYETAISVITQMKYFHQIK